MLHRRISFLPLLPLLVAPLVAAAGERPVSTAGPAALAAPASTAGSEPAPLERWTWYGKLEAGRTIRIDNPFGDVRVRFGGYEGKVEAQAVVQRLAPGGPRLEMTGKQGPDEVSIVAAEKDPPLRAGTTAPHDRADVVVFAPKGAVVEVRTVAGLAEVKGVRGKVSVRTEKGKVLLAGIEGEIAVENDEGETSALLEPPLPGSSSNFRSRTGAIAVHLPAEADVDLRAATAADITTDFSIEIEHRDREEPDKVGRAKVGRGGASLSLDSLRGSLRILRRPPVPHTPVASPAPADSASAPPAPGKKKK